MAGGRTGVVKASFVSGFSSTLRSPVPVSLRIPLIVGLFLLVGGGVWFLLRPGAAPPEQTSISSLSDSTTIRWTEEGVTAVDASSPLDALAGLGYAHGLRRGWTVILWRQTALGRLSEWFGTGLLSLDEHTRRLGLAREAEATYKQLPSPTKRRLEVYTDGLNAALQSDHVREKDPFVFFDLEPEPWAPWHTLLVERLIAWLGTSPSSIGSPLPPDAEGFRQVDKQLRRWLHLHGWERSAAWALRPSDGEEASTPVLFQRHVLGATATPAIQEVILDWSDGPPLTTATLPGAPLFVTGTTGSSSWATLLRSSSHPQPVPTDSGAIEQWHERLTPVNGDETLLRIRRLNDALPFRSYTRPSGPSADPRDQVDRSPARARPDTTWVLRWPGFSRTTDLPAWMHRAGLSSSLADTTSFSLFEPDALRVRANGDWEVDGTPNVVIRDSTRQLVYVGQSRWTHDQAHSLQSHYDEGSPVDASRWSASDSSTWAADLLSAMQPALQRFKKTHPQFQDVATYLQNWNHSYEPTSIGATVFEHWMRAYKTKLGHIPTRADTSVYFATYRQHRALLQALDTLTAQLGPDVRRWRWERVVPDRRFFPVWSADSLVRPTLQGLRSNRYAPIERQSRGHPSTLMGGASPMDPIPTAHSPTTWEGWTGPSMRSLNVRRLQFDPTTFLGRSQLPADTPEPIRVSDVEVAGRIVLLPTRP